MRVTTEKGHPAIIDGATKITFKEFSGKVRTMYAKQIRKATWQRLDPEGGLWEKSKFQGETEIATREIVIACPDDFIENIPLRMNLHYGRYEPVTGQEKERS